MALSRVFFAATLAGSAALYYKTQVPANDRKRLEDFVASKIPKEMKEEVTKGLKVELPPVVDTLLDTVSSVSLSDGADKVRYGWNRNVTKGTKFITESLFPEKK